MRIQFKIKESLISIIEEILHSDKWLTIIREDKNELKRVIIKDPYFESEASVEIWENEIHIMTAWSNYTYRIYQQGETVWCEYTGAYKGLLEQNLLPKFTPQENFLESEVVSSSLLSSGKESLRHYSTESRKHAERPINVVDFKEHPKIVYDEFIKIGVPLPPYKINE